MSAADYEPRADRCKRIHRLLLSASADTLADVEGLLLSRSSGPSYSRSPGFPSTPFVCLYIYIYMYTVHIYIYIYMYSIYVYICVCVYIYIYTYIYIYIYDFLLRIYNYIFM